MEDQYGVATGPVQEFMLAGVRVHHLPAEGAGRAVRDFCAGSGTQRIVFLTAFDLAAAWLLPRKKARLNSAALVLPLHKGIQRAARIAGAPLPTRHMPFQLVIQLLGAVEDEQGSLFLVGGRPSSLEKAEANLRYTFPKLKIFGRFQGYYRKSNEFSLLTAVRKSSPDIFLAGTGIRGGDRWIRRHADDLPTGMSISVPDVFKVFAGQKKRRPSRRVFQSGIEETVAALLLPWHWLRIPLYLLLFFRLLADRLQRRRTS